MQNQDRQPNGTEDNRPRIRLFKKIFAASSGVIAGIALLLVNADQIVSTVNKWTGYTGETNIIMTVTIDENDYCDNHNTLDVVVSNNSKDNILLTRTTLVPEWVKARFIASSAPISEQYDVLLDPWVDLLRGPSVMGEGFPSEEELKAQGKYVKLAEQYCIKEWDYCFNEALKPDPIEVKEVLKDKFYIAPGKVDRFKIRMAVEGGAALFYGMVKLVIETDTKVILTSKPQLVHICTA